MSVVPTTQKDTATSRASTRDARPFPSKDLNRIMRDVGIKRSARNTGEAVFDFDALKSVEITVNLAAYIAQISGHRTVQPRHIELASQHTAGTKLLTADTLKGLRSPKKKMPADVA
jgi:histone H3/H4